MEILVIPSHPLVWIDSTAVGHMATIASGSRKCIGGFCKCRVEREKTWDADEMEQMF